MRETIRHNIKTPYSLHDMNLFTQLTCTNEMNTTVFLFCNQFFFLGGFGFDFRFYIFVFSQYIRQKIFLEAVTF